MPDPQDEYIIDQILPSNCVHLIVGPSGAGKTTLMVQILEDWSQGKPVWGYRSYPAPFLYMSADRPGKAFQKTLERMGGAKIEIPTYFRVDRNDDSYDMENLIRKVRTINPQLKVLFVDGISILLPDGRPSDFAGVRNWLTKLNRLCVRYAITIIGLTYDAKAREGEQYRNPRQKVLGSVLWEALTETIILVEHSQDVTGPGRVVTILPHNAPTVVYQYRFVKGRLVNTTDDMDQCILDIFIQQQAYEVEIAKSQMVAVCPGTPERTVEFWIKRRVEQNILRHARHGYYKRVQTV